MSRPVQPQGDAPRLPGVTTTVRRVRPTRGQLVERVRALETENARVLGIARMRRRHLDELTRALNTIAETGCAVAAYRGHPLVRCDMTDRETMPCNACIARDALAAPGSEVRDA